MAKKKRNNSNQNQNQNGNWNGNPWNGFTGGQPFHNANGNQGHGNQGRGNNNAQQQHKTNYPKCIHCGKYSHWARDCTKKDPTKKYCNTDECYGTPSPHSPQTCPYKNGNATSNATNNAANNNTNDVTMTSPPAAPTLYCNYCNDKKHTTDDCLNSEARKDYQESKLKCLRCGIKNHAFELCKNPVQQDCAYCFGPGHNKFNCPNRKHNKSKQNCKTPTTAVRMFFRGPSLPDKPKRSQFEPEKFSFELQLHPSQAMRREHTALTNELAQYRYTWSEDQVAFAEQYLEDLKRQIRDSESHPYGPRSTVSSTKGPVAPIATPIPAVKRTVATTAAIVPSAYQSVARNAAPISYHTGVAGSTKNISQVGMATRASSLAAYAAHYGRGLDWLDQAAQHELIRETAEYEKLINQKIASSRKSYSAQEYMRVILQHEPTIIAHTGVTSRRMMELKYYIQQGMRIWRDPLTIAALFGRKLAVCNGCGDPGIMFDHVFNEIHPMTSAGELYDLSDGPEWGLFIIFRCTANCSKNGYTFQKMPRHLMENFDMTDKQYRPWGELAWEVR